MLPTYSNVLIQRLERTLPIGADLSQARATETVFALFDPEQIDLLRLLGGSAMDRASLFSWTASDQIDVCVTLTNPKQWFRPDLLTQKDWRSDKERISVLDCLDFLHLRGWEGTNCKVVHNSASKIYDKRHLRVLRMELEQRVWPCALQRALTSLSIGLALCS